jgi:hypothetical protein
MEVLIKTATGDVVQRWGAPPGRIHIPAEKLTIDPGDDPRPMDVGDNHFLATAVVIEPPLGADQKRGPETVDVVGQAVTLNRPAVDLNAQEIADRDQNADIAELSRSVDKLAFIQTELIDKLLAQGTIQADDFTAPVKQIFLDVKTIVDRAKPT